MQLAGPREPRSSHDANAASTNICPVSPESPVIGLQHLEGQLLPPLAQPSSQHQTEQRTERHSAQGCAEAAEGGAGELTSSSFFAFCDPASGGFALPPSPTKLPMAPLATGFSNITSALGTDASCTHSTGSLPREPAVSVASASRRAAASQSTAESAAASRAEVHRIEGAREMGQDPLPMTGSAAPPVLATPLTQRRDPTGCEEGAAVPRHSTPFSVRLETLRRSPRLCQAHRVSMKRRCLAGLRYLFPKLLMRQHLERDLQRLRLSVYRPDSNKFLPAHLDGCNDAGFHMKTAPLRPVDYTSQLRFRSFAAPEVRCERCGPFPRRLERQMATEAGADAAAAGSPAGLPPPAQQHALRRPPPLTPATGGGRSASRPKAAAAAAAASPRKASRLTSSPRTRPQGVSAAPPPALRACTRRHVTPSRVLPWCRGGN